jgi:hypothetical protein
VKTQIGGAIADELIKLRMPAGAGKEDEKLIFARHAAIDGDVMRL